MYIGSTSSHGLNQLVYELISNALDEFVRGRASTISVRIEGDSVEVQDDGDGLPFGQSSLGGRATGLEDFMTVWRDTPPADDHAPHVYIGRLGHGLGVVYALTADLEIADDP
jgi:DNA gyrase subunit B